MCAPGALTGRWIKAHLAADTMRKQSRIFIFRRHDHPIALEVVEIFRERQGHAWADTRVGGIDNGILAQFGEVGDAWVFNAPHFFWEVFGVGQ